MNKTWKGNELCLSFTVNQGIHFTVSTRIMTKYNLVQPWKEEYIWSLKLIITNIPISHYIIWLILRSDKKDPQNKDTQFHKYQNLAISINMSLILKYTINKIWLSIQRCIWVNHSRGTILNIKLHKRPNSRWYY